MNVLSLFDGQSCGQIALKELGIIPDKYYASEIDKHAIAQTQLNFPNTIQLGSVVDVDVTKLEPIQLLLGGSPCQSFSFAGKRNGMSTTENEEIYTLDRYLQLKSEGFQFEGQSYLFWEYMRILTDIRKYNPDVKFLLENVEMGDKWERVLSEAIGVFGVHINSALVSAQQRKRIYWANLRVKQVGLFGELHSDIPQPKDEGILLKDILEEEVDERYYIKNKCIGFDPMGINGKCNTLRVGGRSSQSNKHNFDIIKLDKQLNIKPNQDKASCFTAGGNSGGNHSDMDLICIKQLPRGANKGGLFQDKCPTLTSNSFEHNNHVLKNCRIRRLTPKECARLQTIPEWYKWEFVESNYFGYICSVTKKTIICKANVTPMAVSDRFQINQQDYATCTTLDLLELEKQRVEKLTKQKSVKLTAAIDMLKQNNTETYVSCITKDFIDMERGNFQSNNIKKNVSFVIKKLVAEELTECAPVIIEVSNYMEIHLLLKKGKTNLKYQLNQQDIMGVKIKNRDTKQLWSIKLGDLLKTEKLSTILTLVNWIIDRKIYIYAKDVLNIRLSIGNLNVSEQNYIGVELSDLRMESIISCSDTQQYRMLGNGWTVKVIMHILKYLK